MSARWRPDDVCRLQSERNCDVVLFVDRLFHDVRMHYVSQMALTGAAFSQCTACSAAVVGALRAGGWPWLLSALRVCTCHLLGIAGVILNAG